MTMTIKKITAILEDRVADVERRLATIDRNVRSEIKKVNEAGSMDVIIDSADTLRSLRRERAVTHTQALILSNLLTAIKGDKV